MSDKIITINDLTEIRKVDDVSGIQVVHAADLALTATENVGIRNISGCEQIILKTSYEGAQGPKGDTGDVNSFVLPDLAARFRAGLI